MQQWLSVKELGQLYTNAEKPLALLDRHCQSVTTFPGASLVNFSLRVLMSLIW